MDHVKCIKTLINSYTEQIKILQKELEILIPEMTIDFNNSTTKKIRTIYAKYYPEKFFLNIDLVEERKEFLDVIFLENTENDAYKYIYGDAPYKVSRDYYYLSALKKFYAVCNDDLEKNRLKGIYDKIRSKNMALANYYYNCILPKESIKAIRDINDEDRFKSGFALKSKDFINTLIFMLDNDIPIEPCHEAFKKVIDSFFIGCNMECFLKIE